ncbi:unnamed protein product [Cyprideis torosa]|uniref:Uncharacterized protein n=1 Tax=Cyprideis torosa TaxID=163714 RepID=A0A7R8W5Y7_9CRUS|nr:unnamed protein product [Cyprideis torosa]CAG0881974.1 unnamed protein product [Cyprideis torosa]
MRHFIFLAVCVLCSMSSSASATPVPQDTGLEILKSLASTPEVSEAADSKRLSRPAEDTLRAFKILGRIFSLLGNEESRRLLRYAFGTSTEAPVDLVLEDDATFVGRQLEE